MVENDFILDCDLFFSDFKSMINLDGSIVEAVVESVDAKNWVSGAVERADVRINVRTRDVPNSTARQPGGIVIVDGKRFVVVSRQDDLGMTTLDLARGRGY